MSDVNVSPSCNNHKNGKHSRILPVELVGSWCYVGVILIGSRAKPS